MRYPKTSQLPFVLWLITIGLALSLMVAAQNTSPQATPNSNPQAGQGSAPPPQSTAPNTAAPQGNSSQNPQSGAPQSGARTVEDELQLTPDQKVKIASIVDDENKQIEAVRNDNSMSLEQKQQKVMQIRQEGSPKIKAILTPEQLQKLTAIQQRMRQEQQQGGSSNPPPSNPPQSAPQNPPQH